MVYRACDVPKRTVLAPLINGTKPSQPQLSVGALGHGYRRNTSWVRAKISRLLIVRIVWSCSYSDAMLAIIGDIAGPSLKSS